MRGSHEKTRSILALLLAVPLALACQPGEQGQQAGQPEQQEMEMEEPVQQQERPMGQSATASLTAMNESGVTGEVQLTREANTLTVDVTAEMEGAGEYPSHIHEGTCQQPGGVVTPLNSPTASETGTAEATTEVDAGQLQAGNSHLVMVHNEDGAPAACAEIPGSVIEAGGA